jgi:signal recognition particle subunit SRP54
MLEKLSSVLKNTFNKIASAIFIDQKIVNEIIKDLQRALIESDVDIHIVFELSEKIKKKALEEKSSLEKKEQLIKLIHDEIVNILGKEKSEIKLKKAKPEKIMLVGLYGSGKTTTAAKLAYYYNKRGMSCCLVGLDVHRPAAPEQLEQMAKKANIPCFINKKEKDAMKIWNEFESQIKKYDIAIIDTAGRDALDKGLIEEIKKLGKKIEAEHTVLVIQSDIGQAAKKQASEFKKACNIDGVIITRMDGTAKGGGAITACVETGANVLFIGTGEKLADIEIFNPTSFVSRILGMGDLEALLEKAKSVISPEDQEKMEERLKEGNFSLLDLYEQLKTMQGMGPLSKITEMIPGLGKMKIPSEILEVQGEKMKKWKFAIDSMTKEEIEDPDIIDSSRINRISKGSSVSTADIRALLKQYKTVKKFFGSGIGPGNLEGMDQKKLAKLAKKFGGKFKF